MERTIYCESKRVLDRLRARLLKRGFSQVHNGLLLMKFTREMPPHQKCSVLVIKGEYQGTQAQ